MKHGNGIQRPAQSFARRPSIYRVGEPVKKKASLPARIIAYVLIAMLVVIVFSYVGQWMIGGLRTFIDVFKAAF